MLAPTCRELQLGYPLGLLKIIHDPATYLLVIYHLVVLQTVFSADSLGSIHSAQSIQSIPPKSFS